MFSVSYKRQRVKLGRGYGLSQTFGWTVRAGSRPAGGRGAVSVSKRAGVFLICGDLGDFDGQSAGGETVLVESGGCLGFCGAVCCA